MVLLRDYIVRYSRYIYYRLPFSQQFKLSLASIVFRIFGQFFKNTATYELLSLKLKPKPFPTPEAIINQAGGIDSVLNKISFSFTECPLVSIIIPAYGKLDYTACCLLSISTNLPGVNIEVIVIEDASGEAEANKLYNVKGLHYFVNQSNLGFIKSCNHAAKKPKENIFIF